MQRAVVTAERLIRTAGLAAIAALGLACDPQEGGPISPTQAMADKSLPVAPVATPKGGETTMPIVVREPEPSPSCPADMVLVEGAFCPTVDQLCEQWDPSSGPGAERCLEFRKPSRCLAPQRLLMRFCIDRYEWPNQRGVRPQLLTSWQRAEEQCSSAGKRLCEESEWLFACEGEEMLPYTYGYRRDPTICVVDRFYEAPAHPYEPWAECLADSKCREALERVNQSEPAGAFSGCKSPFGAYDMNGNANEWVRIPHASYPRRSGLKGGWWGPVRGRCRPMVRFHKEDDWGYEVGFRCCRNAIPN